MPENTRLGGNVDQIDVAFVERGATPKLLMKLSIQFHLSGLKRRTTSFSNCFSNADAETANEWLRSFSFAWNQRI